jgi:hypothetical protein
MGTTSDNRPMDGFGLDHRLHLDRRPTPFGGPVFELVVAPAGTIDHIGRASYTIDR